MNEMRIGFLGFGEMGQRFATDLRAAAPERALLSFDPLMHQAAAGEAMRQVAAAQGVEALSAAGGLGERCNLILSAVTADQTLAAAQSLCTSPLGGAWFVDLNSAAPATKRECAGLVEDAGGRYVEVAVMTSVPPHGIRVPMLLGGPQAHACEPLLRALGFSARATSTELGTVSAIKLCRSVIIKGLEALVIESFAAARVLGVERQVLDSLNETYPQIDWEKQGDYLFGRSIHHGRRRAEEMRACAQMLDATGVGGTLAAAAARRHDAISTLRAAEVFHEPTTQQPWRVRADEMKRALSEGAEDGLE